ncbi:hypothetical protein M0C34_12605 [Agarivorans sp. TSD2052]|uniref:hypothetical protein n=1 Tax=Agarivorans sp. TSD2052 TaxID=2937286 RepID=UPI002010B160|nr:hypothetical protein [Agarivorans sp. TSD2052]UPW17089.1 hypothetical protein M0C34_12605 [Agarivorans sp. TSD2052]
MFEWTNPNCVNLNEPFIYFIRVKSDSKEFRYVGKASKKSRLNEYRRNIEKIMDGKPRRPEVKKDGTHQSKGNLRYRFVHLVLSVAFKNNWTIEQFPIENVPKDNLNERETQLIRELECNMNNGKTWSVEEFQDLESSILGN